MTFCHSNTDEEVPFVFYVKIPILCYGFALPYNIEKVHTLVRCLSVCFSCFDVVLNA